MNMKRNKIIGSLSIDIFTYLINLNRTMLPTIKYFNQTKKN